MRKVRIDSKFLGIFSNSVLPYSTNFGRVSNPNDVINNPTILNRRGDSLQLNLNYCEGHKKFSTNSFCYKKMDELAGDSDYYNNEENCLDNCERRISTFEDVHLILSILKEVFEYQNRNVSSWIVEVSQVIIVPRI